MSSDELLERRARLWLPAFLAMGMSAFVAAVVTVINTGIDAGLFLRWLLAAGLGHRLPLRGLLRLPARAAGVPCVLPGRAPRPAPLTCARSDAAPVRGVARARYHPPVDPSQGNS